MMAVRDTSIKTYHQIIDEGLVGEMQERVMVFIEANPNVTDREISKILGMEINAVCGRRNELVDMGIVCENGKRSCTVTGRKVYQWKLADPIKYKSLDSDGLKDKDMKMLFKKIECANIFQLDKIMYQASKTKHEKTQQQQQKQSDVQSKLSF